MKPSKPLDILYGFPVHRFGAFEGPPLPAALDHVPERPLELYVHGRREALALLDRLPHRGLAVVGTREPQPRSQQLVRSQLRELVGADLVILSGLARGIDAAAHEAALEASLPTVAILGGGLDILYPRENQDLRLRILASGGLVVSEFPLGTEPRSHHFLRRNRLIAGLAQATWVVEAAHRSGALNTACWAREQGRTCFATPCFPGDPALGGNQRLLDRDHAVPFWAVDSLGIEWLELATRGPGGLARRSRERPAARPLEVAPELPFRPPASDEDRILAQVRQMTAECGGAEVGALMDWAIAQDWQAQRLFAALQELSRNRRLRDQAGVLVALD